VTSSSSLPVPTTPVRSMQRSGFFRSIAVGVWLTACGVHYGFSEGAFPPHVHTMAILPFENQTAAAELQSELFETMHHELQKRLGVRDAAQDRADAIVRGVITS